jgi:hypothetical protein
LCGFSPPHFGPPQTCGLLYGRAKTSYTAGTLCEIKIEYIAEKNQKMVDSKLEKAIKYIWFFD